MSLSLIGQQQPCIDLINTTGYTITYSFRSGSDREWTQLTMPNNYMRFHAVTLSNLNDLEKFEILADDKSGVQYLQWGLVNDSSKDVGMRYHFEITKNLLNNEDMVTVKPGLPPEQIGIFEFHIYNSLNSPIRFSVYKYEAEAEPDNSKLTAFHFHWVKWFEGLVPPNKTEWYSYSPEHTKFGFLPKTYIEFDSDPSPGVKFVQYDLDWKKVPKTQSWDSTSYYFDLNTLGNYELFKGNFQKGK